MTMDQEARFDVDTMRKRVGRTAFNRGEDYHRAGHVEMIAGDAARIVARVSGTEDYRTELVGRGKDIGGTCSCRAFVDGGFCKHMVAVALAANAIGDDADAPIRIRIRDHLKQQSVDALVDLILGLAERDFALLNRLDMAVATANADDDTIADRMRKVIDRATDIDGHVDYEGASDWAAGVDAALDSVSQLVAAGRGRLALDLVERAIDRLEDAMGSIDDSGGECSALLDRCGELHLAAAQTAAPDPVRFAHDLFHREIEGEQGLFEGAVEPYADILGEAGLAEYRRLAAEAWAKLPPRGGRAAERDGPNALYLQLVGILDFFAERAGDINARIALRAKDLSSPWAYLTLAEFCLAQGRKDDALRYAEEGLWLFEYDRQDERLVLFACRLLTEAHRAHDAETLLQRVFAKAPSLHLYVELRQFGPAAGEWAIECLEAKLAEAKPTRWDSPADLLIRVLMHETAYARAWAVLRAHGASPGLKETLARASEAAHPQEAVAVYAERVDHLAKAGGDPAYAEAAALIGRMGRLQSAAEQARFIAQVKQHHGRKRNFMRLLG